MLLEVASDPDGACLKLSGELDATAADELDARLAALLPELPTHVVVDLRALTALHSQGLRSFLRLDKALKAEGKAIVIRGAIPSVFRVFRYCGLDTYFRFVETLGAEALAGRVE